MTFLGGIIVGAVLAITILALMSMGGNDGDY